MITDPDVWCDECGRMAPFSQMDEAHVCRKCRGMNDLPPVQVGLSLEEKEAVLSISVRASADWTVTRDHFHGTDEEWAEIVRALKAGRNATKEQEAILDEAADALTDDWYTNCYDPDIDLRLRAPRKKEVAA